MVQRDAPGTSTRPPCGSGVATNDTASSPARATEPGSRPWQPIAAGAGPDVAPHTDLFDGTSDGVASRRGSGRSVWVAVAALVALVAVGVLALATFLTGATGRSRLDVRAIEERIGVALSNQDGVTTTVSCPDSVVIAAGATFTCTAETDDGTTSTVVVRQVDDEGNVRWRVSG